MGEDAKGLGLAVFAAEPLDDLASLGALAEKRHGGFGEGPLQVDVADLGAPETVGLAGGFPGALDQAAVGGELLHAVEASDVVDLVEDRESEDLADAGDGAEPMEGVGVVLLGGAGDVEPRSRISSS